MRSRSRLHFNQIAAFIEFCESQGWCKVPVKGDYECLRMRHPGQKEPMIVHSTNSASAHFTTWGKSDSLAKKFIEFKKQKGTV